jgi:multiple sugar transport system ATP-binding protein
VTHDQIEAMTLGSRVAVMNQGRVMQLDEPGRVYADPANLFVAGFMGSPPMNFVRGEIIDRLFQAPETRLDASAINHRGACIVGFRPEDATIVADASTSTSAIRGKVFAVEPLGESTLVTLSSPVGRLVVRASKDSTYAIDAPLAIDVPAQRLFFFDPTTEDRIRS